MAYYVIMHSTANLVASYDDEAEALDALERIVREDPEQAAEYALIQYDNSGQPVGEATVGSDLGVSA